MSEEASFGCDRLRGESRLFELAPKWLRCDAQGKHAGMLKEHKVGCFKKPAGKTITLPTRPIVVAIEFQWYRVYGLACALAYGICSLEL